MLVNTVKKALHRCRHQHSFKTINGQNEDRRRTDFPAYSAMLAEEEAKRPPRKRANISPAASKSLMNASLSKPTVEENPRMAFWAVW
jgi:hypothetical protein